AAANTRHPWDPRRRVGHVVTSGAGFHRKRMSRSFRFGWDDPVRFRKKRNLLGGVVDVS
ncbi:unnamed protein product, partial [Brassica napus]